MHLLDMLKDYDIYEVLSREEGDPNSPLTTEAWEEIAEYLSLTTSPVHTDQLTQWSSYYRL